VPTADFREQIGVYVLYDQFQNIVYIGQAGNGNASPGLDSSKPSIKMVHSVHNKMLNQAYLVSNTLML